MIHVCQSDGLGYCPCAQRPVVLLGAAVAKTVTRLTALRIRLVNEREASPHWRGWTVRLVFRRGQPILGVSRLDGADNSRNMPESRAARDQRIRNHGIDVGLTRAEANSLYVKLDAKLGKNAKTRRTQRRRA